jgi:hypothetical protein
MVEAVGNYLPNYTESYPKDYALKAYGGVEV